MSKNNELEEAIENLSEIIYLYKKEIENNDTNITAILDLEDLKSLKIVLEAYERLENKVKEQEQSKKDLIKAYLRLREENIIYAQEGNKVALQIHIADNYISKSKIKEKIEELKQQDKEWTEELSEPDSNFKIIDKHLKRIKNQIDILQELLEDK